MKAFAIFDRKLECHWILNIGRATIQQPETICTNQESMISVCSEIEIPSSRGWQFWERVVCSGHKCLSVAVWPIARH